MNETPWYTEYIKPGDIWTTYQRGYRLGAALALGLPPESFAGVSYARWGDFFQAWKENTGKEYIPYESVADWYAQKVKPEDYEKDFPLIAAKIREVQGYI